jgi:O-acetyl-ADP-ribose deacetylase (regulator of RNase III)
MPFSIILGDITKMNTDAIVDATGDSQHAEKCSARIFCKTADLFYTKVTG